MKDDKDRKPFYLNACRMMGIGPAAGRQRVELDFAPVRTGEPKIRYGLSAVRNVGAGAVSQVIDARHAKGEFTSFGDFCRKVDPSVLTKKVLGEPDPRRRVRLAGACPQGAVREPGQVSAPIVAERKAEAAGEFSLFGGGDGPRTRSTRPSCRGRSSTSRCSSSRRRRCSGSS